MASLFRRSLLLPVCQAPQLPFNSPLQRLPVRLCRACSQGSSRTSKLSARERRMQRSEILRRNRKNPELEKAARTNTLVVPLEEVQREWQLYRGLDQLRVAGQHFQLYRDLYQQVFRPQRFMRVQYGQIAVHRGTVISPCEAASPPTVTNLPVERLCSLVLSDPDGHLLDHRKELLHWMILNVRGGDLSSGEEVCPYLQPVPPRGSGLHRYVFSLYSHHEPLDVGSVGPSGGGTWLERRTFSTAEFLTANPSVQPLTFNVFQAQWDSSVHSVYMESLVYPEPVYGVEKELTLRQKKQVETRQRKANHYRVM